MRPSVFDPDQPHHVVSREDEYGRSDNHCACGHVPPGRGRDTGDYAFRRRGGKLVYVNLLHEHVEAGFDGRCHFKRYGMECMRFYGHRGLHWTKPGSKMSDFYTCPVCDMTSHNPDDVASKYCGNCHKFEFECAQQAAIRKRRNTKSAPDDQSGQ